MSDELSQLGSIFLVDDEEDILEHYEFLLEDTGIKTKKFLDPTDALEAIKKEDPAFVISDYQMPGMSGVDLCKEMRKIRANTPFILVTAFADKEVAIEGLKHGVSNLLEKPVKTEDFKKLLAETLSKLHESNQAEEDELEEIRVCFVEEATDLMRDLDQTILRLEEEPLDPVVVDSIFRKIHSVKGGAGAIPNAGELASLGHQFENSLSLIRKGEMKPSPECVNAYLSAVDLCRELLELVDQKKLPDEDQKSRVQDAIQTIDGLKEGPKTEKTTKASEKPTPDLQKPKIESRQPQEREDKGVLVSNERLDTFMKLSGEMVVLKNAFQILTRDPDLKSDHKKLDKKHGEILYSLNKLTDQLQDQIMSVRKVSLDHSFGKLPRMVRQASQQLGKKVKLTMTGIDLGVDKNISKALSSCMTHIIRNSVDHGIECVEKRLESGKSEEGLVSVSAKEEKGSILLSIEDDGGGIDREKVLKKALEKGLVDESKASTLTSTQIFDLIFLPGFSTAEKVSNISGRGVGMDAVKTAILDLNGRIQMDSELNKGTKIEIEIPVPKSVMVYQTVVVKSFETNIAIPMTCISQITPLRELTIAKVNHILTCQYLGRTIPLVTYRELVNNTSKDSPDTPMGKSVVIIQEKNRYVALLVDSIEYQLEAVVRPFDEITGSIPGFLGVTVQGDDQFAYVLSGEEIAALTEVLQKERLRSHAPEAVA